MRLLTEHANTTLEEITPDHIISFCARPHLSQSSRASYHASIRAFYKWAVRAEKLATDPTVMTPVPKRPKGQPRPIHTTHVDTMLATATRKRAKAMIILAAYAGLRIHEVAKFHSNDLDQYSGIITVTGKGGKTAMIPAHDRILELAKTMPAGYWFPSYDHLTNRPHVAPKAVGDVIRRAMRRAGVIAKPHQLRHWYATELLEKGVDVRIVKDLMRHESLATTEIYTRVSMSQMRDGLLRLVA